MNVYFLLPRFRVSYYILYINLLKAVKKDSERYTSKGEKEVSTKFLEGTLSNKYLAHLKQDFK